MAPRVTIDYTSTLDKAFNDIMESLDARYHRPGNSFPDCHPTDAELTKLSSLATHASHASDGLLVRGNYVSTDGGSTWTHIERLVR